MNRYRLTKGQSAAVCGLVIAGVSLTQACPIVGVPYKQMRDHLGDWHEKMQPKLRWKGDLLAEVREAWLDPSQKVATIAARYGVSMRGICWLAVREGWPKRRRGPRRGKASVLSMPPEKRRRYWKLSRVLGASAAKDIIAGEMR